MIRIFALTAIAIMLSGPALAGEWDATGFFGIDSQAFWLDGRFPGQDDNLNLSVMLQPELYWRSDDGNQRFSIVGFARKDFQDDERSHVDLREAIWGYESAAWDINIGIGKVFWGVTESRHLVNVINQTDLVEDIDGEDKLGQPMINFNLQRDYGRFEFYALPLFRERTFPGPEGRFRPPLPVDTDNALYKSSKEDTHVDFAFRYSHYIGDLDIGLHLFDGTSREPEFELAAEGDRLIPFYDQMTQVGLDLQYTRDAWLWKLEALGRNTSLDTFAAAVGGFEYTFYGVRDSDIDVGLLMEYLYDGRNAESPPTAFDNDLFFGSRIALNDSNDTSVLAGLVIDLDSRETFLNVEAERRVSDRLSIELRLRSFMNSSPGGSLNSLEHDDYAQLRLSWYF